MTITSGIDPEPRLCLIGQAHQAGKVAWILGNTKYLPDDMPGELRCRSERVARYLN